MLVAEVARKYKQAGKPWSLEDDRFIYEFRFMGLDFIGPHDLDRSPEETKARWDFLVRSNAHRAMLRMSRAEESAWPAKGRSLRYRRGWRKRFAKALADYEARVAAELSQR